MASLAPAGLANDPPPQAPQAAPGADDLLPSLLDRPSYSSWTWASWTGERVEPIFARDLVRGLDGDQQAQAVPDDQGGPGASDDTVQAAGSTPEELAGETADGEPRSADTTGTAEPVGGTESTPAGPAVDALVDGAGESTADPAVDPTGSLPTEPNTASAESNSLAPGELPAGTLPTVEGVVEAAAPAPFAELDLDLYARASAPVPPGIPTSRIQSRTTARATARKDLAAALRGPDGETWLSFLAEQLRYGQDASTTWRGLAELVVELELFDLAPALATGLESDSTDLVFQVARGSLGELYGRDFDGLADFEAFTEGLDLSPSTRRVLAELRLARSSSREHLLELLTFDRGSAVEHLDDPDPIVRAGAASVLATALAEGDEGAADLLPALLDRLTVERWPDVAAVLLDAAGDALEGRPAGDPMIERLRSGLADATGAKTIGAELLVATALARLPWTGELPAQDSLEYGTDLIARLVDRALPEGAVTSPDADVALGVLRAVESMLRGAGGDLATAERLSSGDLVAPLERLLRERSTATSVRVVAAGILPEVAPASGLVLVNELLADGDAGLTTELRFALLSAVGRFARRGDAGPEVLAPTADRLVVEFARPEADLRRTALELLAEESLAPFLVGRDLTPFVEQLGQETDPELEDALLALLERHGTTTTLRRVLALGSFDALIARDAAGEASMARLIGKLAGGDPLLVLEGAKFLWDVEGEEGQVSRRTRALALVAELPVEVVAPLEGSAHYVISHWATTLRAQGVDLATAMPGGVAFLQRLVDVHVSRMGSNTSYTPADQALMTALFLSDIVAAPGSEGTAEMSKAVLAKFAQAEEFSAEHPNKDFRRLVMRSRARFLASSGDSAALVDFEKLFQLDLPGLLETVDLRAAGQLAQTAGDLAGIEASWRYSRALVGHESWSQEPPAVRLEDLRSLAARARASTDLEVLTEAMALFDGLPAEAGTAVAGEEQRVWHGLVGDGATLTVLARLHSELADATEAVVASQPAPPTPPAPVVDSTDEQSTSGNG